MSEYEELLQKATKVNDMVPGKWVSEEEIKKLIHKHDNGKNRLSLVSPYLIEAVGWIRTYGTDKYGDPEGWRQVEKERYIDALLRHLMEFLKDNYSIDDESGYPHLWHVACNINFLTEMIQFEPTGKN